MTKTIYGNPNMKDCFDEFAGNDKKRIKVFSARYRNKSISQAFAEVYKMPVLENASRQQLALVNNVSSIEVGKIYKGQIKSLTKNGILLEAPGVKAEIVCKENFADCLDNIQIYALKHDNSLLFEVREIDKHKIVVSIINAYYRKWVEQVENAMKTEQGMQVHIDDLVQGGYVCKTNIGPLCDLTGKVYTSGVFIPGSHIVLNIERDFEKWIGQDVVIVPQKFVDYRYDYTTNMTEKSLVGSRKRGLQIIGNNNTYELYNRWMLSRKDNMKVTIGELEGTVTGIINSANKHGIFVELNDKYITGLMPMEPHDLLKYKPGDAIMVKIKDCEVQPGAEPFVFNRKGTRLLKSNVRFVFEEA